MGGSVKVHRSALEAHLSLLRVPSRTPPLACPRPRVLTGPAPFLSPPLSSQAPPHTGTSRLHPTLDHASSGLSPFYTCLSQAPPLPWPDPRTSQGPQPAASWRA